MFSAISYNVFTSGADPSTGRGNESGQRRHEARAAFFAGIVAALAMLAVLTLARRCGLTSFDFIALWSGLLGRSSGQSAAGFLAFLGAGGFFSVPYLWLLRSARMPSLAAFAAFGLLHGALAIELLRLLQVLPFYIGTHIPIPRSQFSVGEDPARYEQWTLAALVIAHCVYGLTLGAQLGFLRKRSGRIKIITLI